MFPGEDNDDERREDYVFPQQMTQQQTLLLHRLTNHETAVNWRDRSTGKLNIALRLTLRQPLLDNLLCTYPSLSGSSILTYYVQRLSPRQQGQVYYLQVRLCPSLNKENTIYKVNPEALHCRLQVFTVKVKTKGRQENEVI